VKISLLRRLDEAMIFSSLRSFHLVIHNNSVFFLWAICFSLQGVLPRSITSRPWPIIHTTSIWLQHNTWDFPKNRGTHLLLGSFWLSLRMIVLESVSSRVESWIDYSLIRSTNSIGTDGFMVLPFGYPFDRSFSPPSSYSMYLLPFCCSFVRRMAVWSFFIR
jgi:hypothetical protein